METELKEIKTCLSILKKYQDITYYGLESDAVDILILLAKHNYNDDFELVCQCINKHLVQMKNIEIQFLICYLILIMKNINIIVI